MFLADGFEEIEAITPLDILRRADISVTTVAIAPELCAVVGAHGVGVAAAEFGFALVAALKDAQTAADIRTKMLYV